jgi:hypothetical protein
MSIAGKILAIFNVLAAIAFVAVAGLDWGQRERWAFAVFRHDLLVDGLPIDAEEKGPNLKPRVDQFNEPWFAAMFQRVGGRPVKTQTEEVDRLQKDVQAQVTSQDPPGTKSQKLARFLFPLARTSTEREEYAKLATAPPLAEAEKEAKREADLQAALDRQFDGVKRRGADGHEHSDEERKLNAARLLFCLGDAMQKDPNADFLASQDYQRFLIVCGLSNAARAIDDQAMVIQAMTEEATRIHHAELNQFLYDLSQIIYDDQAYADAAERLERILQAKQAEVEKQKQVVTERRVQISKLTDQLNTLRQETGKDLEEQSRQEQEVMRRLIELRETAKKNQELERQIRGLEEVK